MFDSEALGMTGTSIDRSLNSPRFIASPRRLRVSREVDYACGNAFGNLDVGPEVGPVRLFPSSDVRPRVARFAGRHRPR